MGKREERPVGEKTKHVDKSRQRVLQTHTEKPKSNVLYTHGTQRNSDKYINVANDVVGGGRGGRTPETKKAALRLVLGNVAAKQHENAVNDVVWSPNTFNTLKEMAQRLFQPQNQLH